MSKNKQFYILTTLAGKKILCGSIDKTFMLAPYYPQALLWAIKDGKASVAGRYLKRSSNN
jgi:hypothetical protein